MKTDGRHPAGQSTVAPWTGLGHDDQSGCGRKPAEGVRRDARLLQEPHRHDARAARRAGVPVRIADPQGGGRNQDSLRRSGQGVRGDPRAGLQRGADRAVRDPERAPQATGLPWLVCWLAGQGSAGSSAPVVRAAGGPRAAADRDVRAGDLVDPDGSDPRRAGRRGSRSHGAAADSRPRAPSGAVGHPGRGGAAPSRRGS